MAQQQHAADVHPDELCPPNKRYDLMDANKKVELEHVQCPSESKILMNIIKNHPLRFSIAASTSVPWIYITQFWHTLKEYGSKHRLKFLLDRKELNLLWMDFSTIFHLNNEMIQIMLISGLLQPWQTLCKIFSKCLTTSVKAWIHPPLQIQANRYIGLDVTDSVTAVGVYPGNALGHIAPRTPNLLTESAEVKCSKMINCDPFLITIKAICTTNTTCSSAISRKIIIMAQQQHAADVHPDEMCPPNKRYDLMDANKKVDLEHVQCPESKILMNIIKNHPLRFSIAASASVPWIYMARFWHTLKEDESKHRLKFLLDRKELTLTLDDFRTIFHLPQANDNNHASFVPPP
ncbi:hypothetical protein Tco_0348869 [Tanacetum coccineum]